jgi:hypothetical protein
LASVCDRLNCWRKNLVKFAAPDFDFCFAADGTGAGPRVVVLDVGVGVLVEVAEVGVGEDVTLERAASFRASHADRLPASPTAATAASVRRTAVPP